MGEKFKVLALTEAIDFSLSGTSEIDQRARL
jgi:hypothetical protein